MTTPTTPSPVRLADSPGSQIPMSSTSRVPAEPANQSTTSLDSFAKTISPRGLRIARHVITLIMVLFAAWAVFLVASIVLFVRFPDKSIGFDLLAWSTHCATAASSLIAFVVLLAVFNFTRVHHARAEGSNILPTQATDAATTHTPKSTN